MPPGISTHDHKIIKRKIEKTKCKVDNVEKELTDQRELFSACYVSNSQQLKRGQKQQAKWHESRVEELERLKGHLQSFYDSIRNADTFMSDLWHGIDKELPRHEQHRRQVRNTAKAVRDKRNRNNTGPLSYLNKICKEPQSKRCFPEGLKNNPMSQVKLDKSDLKSEDTIFRLIYPTRHESYWKRLIELNTVTDEAESFVQSIIDKKKADLQKKSTKKGRENDESNSDSEIEELAPKKSK